MDALNLLYPISVNNDLGLLDIISANGNNIANVVIYNSGTGAFLDNITRGGIFKNQFMYGVNRDVSYISSFLSYIQTLNRVKDCDTQVYLCGAPNYLGLNLTSLLNNKLKKLADEFANVSYVSPVKSKFLYRSDDGHMGFDIHYDEEEYLIFNYNFISSITNNYAINKVMFELDRYLIFNYNFISSITNNYAINKVMFELDRYMYILNTQIEAGDICPDDAFDSLEYFSIALVNQLRDNDLKYEFYERVRKYITERFPYDYY